MAAEEVDHAATLSASSLSMPAEDSGEALSDSGKAASADGGGSKGSGVKKVTWQKRALSRGLAPGWKVFYDNKRAQFYYGAC